ncbi:GMC family oxidoreductase N-terminal domain-containing protein [Gordonia neofelifaecis]|uniref:Glucose-methanol-choline oxidoreductase n=1 Tax=Gordonia neofelifaecis NRRL B-59395 TaxID=644548 RepID=F1YQ29_9ACTN|nr:GMC family oxidoreductase N-terminal domain-containing protein [Gordonia neofelifaecis]EGD53195.1 glucose-methanol-choline oxidoreductase [Gordonia neofelifaecis NRRL B-59395]
MPDRVVDVLVVGAGSAGCVVAERLSRDSSRRVLLIDSGPGGPPSDGRASLARLPIEPGAPRVTRYHELRGRDVVRGVGLGGSSAVNGGYFLRGHRDDYAAWPWPGDELETALDALDGGETGGGAMSVSSFADSELGEVATAFDVYWRERSPSSVERPGSPLVERAGSPLVERAERVETPHQSPWPTVGLNRVRSNRRSGRRWTAADAFLSDARPNLDVVADCEALELVVRGGRAVGARTTRGVVSAGTVVLAAGTLGTAGLVLPHLGRSLPIHEHAERLVRFRPRRPLSAQALLQTVLHTDDRLEIRCYGDDFASFINGVPPSGVAIGIADMADGTHGSVRWDGAPVIDLGVPDAASTARIDGGVGLVRTMLDSAEFRDLVEPGSVTVDADIGLSSHAWGTLPLGTEVGADGALTGLDGVHVVDGSVLPGPLRSGPHASVMATASLIAKTMAPKSV